MVRLHPILVRPALHTHRGQSDQGTSDQSQGQVQLCPLLPHWWCPHYPGHSGQVQPPGGSQLLVIKPRSLARNGNTAFGGLFELVSYVKIDWKVANTVEYTYLKTPLKRNFLFHPIQKRLPIRNHKKMIAQDKSNNESEKKNGFLI